MVPALLLHVVDRLPRRDELRGVAVPQIVSPDLADLGVDTQRFPDALFGSVGGEGKFLGSGLACQVQDELQLLGRDRATSELISNGIRYKRLGGSFTLPS